MIAKHASRKLIPAAAAAVCLILSACANSADGGDTAKGGGAANGPEWCGSKPITLALTDGIGNNNWRALARKEALDESRKCSSVKKFLYSPGGQNSDGSVDTQKAISDIEGMVAQGANAIVTFPDAGKAELPALRRAFQQGVVVVPYRVSPGGTPGKDYSHFVSTDFRAAGRLWGEWLVKVLNGKGIVANLGGPPANTQSLEEAEGLAEVLKEHPDIQLVGQQPYNATNWDPAQTQKVVTALLAKYPKIDAFTTDWGAAFATTFPTFKQLGRQIPAVGTEDNNQLSCVWKKLKPSNPDFDLLTVDSQTWMVRTAVQVAVAEATGGKVPSTEVPQLVAEDSVSGKPKQPACDPSVPGDAYLSARLSKPQILEALNGKFD